VTENKPIKGVHLGASLPEDGNMAQNAVLR